MARAPVRIVGLGRQDRSDGASAVVKHALELGADAQFIIDLGEGEFDQGLIDWRGMLESKHWLVASSSCTLDGDAMKWAWGSSLTFAELEGCKTAMVVDVPEDSARMGEAWGSVIERIRQIHILFIGPDAMRAVAELEGLDESLLLREIRGTGLVPIVCSFDPDNGVASVSHALGQETIEVGRELGLERWLAGFLCDLPQSGSGASGIISAARSSPGQSR
ncbi:MAG: hypothetical protein CMB60_01750 [Euryarchaeota archaeon]|nr:hypothetical protein [Euryarchaeota archaeon]|tara:strand:+ start:821 stop:1480 length:660 start_codon:yes stop_codon:yes gene_type:complete